MGCGTEGIKSTRLTLQNQSGMVLLAPKLRKRKWEGCNKRGSQEMAGRLSDQYPRMEHSPRLIVGSPSKPGAFTDHDAIMPAYWPSERSNFPWETKENLLAIAI